MNHASDKAQTGPESRRMPTVSVIIPAFNAEAFILDAIHSVDTQQFPGVEILVVDDGSKDSTASLVRQRATHVRLIQQTNGGVASARNTGLRNATGDLICFLDADDGWFSGKLAAQVRHLTRHPLTGAVYHDWTVWLPNAEGAYERPAPPQPKEGPAIDVERSGWIYPQLLLDCIVHTSTLMIRREIVTRVGLFDTGLVTGEDYDYWLRVSQACRIDKLSGTYSFYRAAPGSLTATPKRTNNEKDVVQRALDRWGLTAPDGTVASEQAVRSRLAKLAFDFGYAHFHHGSRRISRRAFAETLRVEPHNWRAAAYWIAASIMRDRQGE